MASCAGCGIENARTGDRVGDSVLEFGVAETNAVGEIAGIEIKSGNVIARVIHIRERLERVGDKWEHALVLVKRKTIEDFVAAGLPIQTSHSLSFTEGRVEVSGEVGEVSSGENGIDQVLLVALSVKEKEKFVLDDGAAQAAAKLVALKRIRGVAGQSGIERLVTKI